METSFVSKPNLSYNVVDHGGLESAPYLEFALEFQCISV